MIKQYFSKSGIQIEVGYFYGPGQDEVITSVERDGFKLTVGTSHSKYDIKLSPGDSLVFEDGSYETIKEKDK